MKNRFVRILLNPVFDLQAYEDAGIIATQEVFAIIQSIKRSDGSPSALLGPFNFSCERFSGDPSVVTLTVAKTKTILYCQFPTENQEGLDYFEVPVKVTYVDSFPSIF